VDYLFYGFVFIPIMSETEGYNMESNKERVIRENLETGVFICIDEASEDWNKTYYENDKDYDRMKDNIVEDQFNNLTESEKYELISGENKFNLNGDDI
jgi:hypothetical protein